MLRLPTLLTAEYVLQREHPHPLCSTATEPRADRMMDSRRKEVNCSSLPPFLRDDFHQRGIFPLTGCIILKHCKQFINRS